MNVSVVSVIAAACVCASGWAQDQPPASNVRPFKLQEHQQAQKKAQEEAAKRAEEAKANLDPNDPMVKYATPGEHHQHLKALTGQWDGEIKMWMAPGTEPEVSTTKATIRMDWEGRYLRANYTGDFNGMPFNGHATWGYNNLRKQYESVWIDNFSTGMMFSTGKCDANGKVFTFTGEADDPMTGKTVKERDVTTVIDSNTWKMEMFRPGPDGKEFKTMEINFKRQGAGGPRRAGQAAPAAKSPARDDEKAKTPAPTAPK